MESRAKLFGHPVHQMLHLVTGDSLWSSMSFWMIGAGILMAVVAAPWGAIDWIAIPSGTRASRIGFVHGVGNILVLVLFAISWWWRRANPETPAVFALLLSFAGGIMSLLTAWLGGELIDRLSVGVDDGANLDAPSSLTNRRVVRG